METDPLTKNNIHQETPQEVADLEFRYRWLDCARIEFAIFHESKSIEDFYAWVDNHRYFKKLGRRPLRIEIKRNLADAEEKKNIDAIRNEDFRHLV